MTHVRYGIALLLQSFGCIRKNKRLTDISTEMHLLQDGEEILGASCWSHAEDIEELSVEYWTIRRLEREQEAIKQTISNLEQNLETAQKRRLQLTNQSTDTEDEFSRKRQSLHEAINQLNQTRDEIMFEAQVIKRQHKALSTKTKVLLEEGSESNEEIDQCRSSLANLKTQFEQTKEKLEQIDLQIDAKDVELTQLKSTTQAGNNSTEVEIQESFGDISQTNREITKNLAKLGLLQEEHSQNCRDVGRFLSLNENRSDCKKTCRSYPHLLRQLKILRTSVRLNRQLVERVSA